MKSDELVAMDVVPATVPPSPTPTVDSELDRLLGGTASDRLRHLMNGAPVLLPGFLNGPAPIEDPERSPRVRFLAGELFREPASDRWYGPVLLESAQWCASYVDPEHLAHLDCTLCAPAWSRAVAFTGGFHSVEVQSAPGVCAQLVTPVVVDHRVRHLRSA